MNEVNLEKLNLQELKALAFDVIVSIQRDQQVLNQVNEYINKKAKEEETDGNK